MHSNILVLVISLMLLTPFEVYTGTATQTDWSGGDGIWGPVFDWGDEFYLDINIECYNNPLNITLLNIPLEHTVGGNFDGAQSVHSADINGDGHMDVLGAAYIDDEITWWDMNGFLPDGLLESSVLDVQESPDWQIIDWTCTEPSGTNVALQVRASDNSSSMGAWSDTLTDPCTLEGILTDEDNYFQYRAILNTTDSLITPVLHNVTVTWNLTGIEVESGDESYVLYDACPNPATDQAVLVFSLSVDTMVELAVYGPDRTYGSIH